MLEFVLALLEFEQLSSVIILVAFVGFGWFFIVFFWPWFTDRVDKSADGWLDLKREELKAEAERDKEFAKSWREHSKELQRQNETLITQGQLIATMVEAQKALIGTLLSFVDDRKLQDRLYQIFYEDGQ